MRLRKKSIRLCLFYSLLIPLITSTLIIQNYVINDVSTKKEANIGGNYEDIKPLESDSNLYGIIIMWSGSIDSIPEGWALCNGSNLTPDLRDRFILSVTNGENPGAIGGANEHNHTYYDIVNHTHTINDPGHHHHTFYRNGAVYLAYNGSDTSFDLVYVQDPPPTGN